MKPERSSAQADTPMGLIRCLVVLEDRDEMRRYLESMFTDKGWIAISIGRWQECKDWALKNVRVFVLDVAIGDDQGGGLRALEQIKEVAPDAYCAVLTEYAERNRPIANKLHANHICGKSENELQGLLELLENLAVPPASAAPQSRVKDLEGKLSGYYPIVEAYLSSGAVEQAARALVHLEGPLAEALELEALGDDFGMVVDALRVALVNAPEVGLTMAQWRVWRKVAEEVFTGGSLETGQALRLADQMDEAGWNTEPASFGALSDFLLNGDERNGE